MFMVYVLVWVVSVRKLAVKPTVNYIRKLTK